MALRKILVDSITALGGSAPYNLVGAEDAFDWSSGSKGPRIGTYYTILRISDMEKQRILVHDPAPAIDPATVLNGASKLQFYKVDFEGLTASVSPDKTGNLRIYAEAKSIKFITAQTATKQ